MNFEGNNYVNCHPLITAAKLEAKQIIANAQLEAERIVKETRAKADKITADDNFRLW